MAACAMLAVLCLAVDAGDAGQQDGVLRH